MVSYIILFLYRLIIGWLRARNFLTDVDGYVESTAAGKAWTLRKVRTDLSRRYFIYWCVWLGFIWGCNFRIVILNKSKFWIIRILLFLLTVEKSQNWPLTCCMSRCIVLPFSKFWENMNDFLLLTNFWQQFWLLFKLLTLLNLLNIIVEVFSIHRNKAVQILHTFLNGLIHLYVVFIITFTLIWIIWLNKCSRIVFIKSHSSSSLVFFYAPFTCIDLFDCKVWIYITLLSQNWEWDWNLS